MKVAIHYSVVFFAVVCPFPQEGAAPGSADERKAVAAILNAASDADRLEALEAISHLPRSNRLGEIMLLELRRGLCLEDLTRDGQAYYHRAAKYLWKYKEHRDLLLDFIRSTRGSRVRAYICSAIGDSQDPAYATDLYWCAILEESKPGELGAMNSALSEVTGVPMFQFKESDGKKELLKYWLDHLISKGLIPE